MTTTNECPICANTGTTFGKPCDHRANPNCRAAGGQCTCGDDEVASCPRQHDVYVHGGPAAQAADKGTREADSYQQLREDVEAGLERIRRGAAAEGRVKVAEADDDLKTWPQRIYLQHQFEYVPAFGVAFRACSDITWCQDKQDRYDIAYVRADLSTAPAPQVAAAGDDMMSRLETRLRAMLDDEQWSNVVNMLQSIRAATKAAAVAPLAWVRRHPDGSFTDEILPDHRIESVRKNSGVWVPLAPFVRPAAAARECTPSLEAENAALRRCVHRIRGLGLRNAELEAIVLDLAGDLDKSAAQAGDAE